MATSYNVNLHITSAVGFRRPEIGVRAPRPIMTTTVSLNGQTFPGVSFGETRIVYVSNESELDVFEYYPGSVSTEQVVKITNEGNTTAYLIEPYFAFTEQGSTPIINTSTFVNWPAIAPGSTATIMVSYAGQESGEFANSITIVSDVDYTPYKLITLQSVRDKLDVAFSPASYSTATNRIGEQSYVTFSIIPVINDIEQTDVYYDYTYSINEASGWRIVSSSQNQVKLGFDSDRVNNTNGTYSAVLEVGLLDAVATVEVVATVNIDYSKNYNIASWISPTAPNNSIIGISYDVINGSKTLTIGVGSGADGSPVYSEGGEIYLDMRALGVVGDTLEPLYPCWAEVYRFSNLGSVANTYLSGDREAWDAYYYRVKTTPSLNYGDYFGNERSYGSMFIVQDDGRGNLLIAMNNVREWSGDADFDQTLDNLSRAFFYYSEADQPNRLTNLVQYPIEDLQIPPVSAATTSTLFPLIETRTKLFKGIEYVSRSSAKQTVGSKVIGATTLTFNSVEGIFEGDIVVSSNQTTLEGYQMAITNINTVTNTVTLSKGIPINISSGATVTVKNPPSIDTTLAEFPK